ncbi:MAG: DNA topoisomerase I [Candidatus Nanoarchaeia archaeon]|nr:DNA topoisomerase I [Candidatus Nanoarchaeia archaeon]
MKPPKPSPLQVEQKEYRIFNPEKIKNTVEIPVKPKPPIEELETIEKIGKPKNKRKKTKEKNQKKNTESTQEPSELNPKGHVLIITEKPQAASKIASALADGSESKKSDNGIPYYELRRNNKNIVVACAVGHLFSVSQSKKGTDYPIFDIEWFPNFEVRKKDFTKKYYSTIKKLVKNASEIIIATDFDTEGEVIGYNIIRFIANQKDAKRMKFSSLTAKELQESYENVHPTIEWGQAIAGETRHFLDWLYGINLSRALMNAIKSTGKFKIMSIGRVQGPALNLIVEKEKQIKAFKSTPYWQVFITINDGKNKLEVKYIKDITKNLELDKFKNLEGRKAMASTSKSKETIIPPPPFDLTALQTEAYKFYSITPSQTLQIAQSLYLAGLISYPRTSSQKIPDSMEPKKILERLSKHFEETKKITRINPVEGKKSDPAHPAIIPTGVYTKLENQEQKIYNLIVKRFISCFCDNAELENKKVEVIIDNLKFNERGMEIIKPAWMEVYPSKMVEKEIKDFNGEVNIEKMRIEEKMTQPPKRYSPASILSELEKRNLGTKATRANILDTLYDRNYIKEKSIEATELGIRLIDSLKKFSPVIIDENLTREIEKDMDHMRESKKELDKKEEITIEKAKNALRKISQDFKKNESEIGKELVQANESLWEQQKQENKLGIKCPNCNTGELMIKFTPRFKSYFIACSAYPNCKQTFPLPSNSLIKKTDKMCPDCNYPMLISIRKAKRPWIFCFNPKCPSRQKKEE